LKYLQSELEAAKRQLGRRLWVAYTGGSPTALGQLLGAETVHQALTTAKYQERVVGADQAAVERVERLRRALLRRLAARARAAARAETRGRGARAGRRPPGGGVRHGADRQALPVGRRQPRRLRLLRAGAGRLPQRRDLPAQGEQGAVVRGAARRPRRPRPRRPGVLRPQHRRTLHHVGMHVGGGAMVEAPYTGARVRTASIGRGDYIGAVRPTG